MKARESISFWIEAFVFILFLFFFFFFGISVFEALLIALGIKIPWGGVMMRKEQILLEIWRTLKEINQKLDKIQEERDQLVEKLSEKLFDITNEEIQKEIMELVTKLEENDIEIVKTYSKLAKLEATIDVAVEGLWDKKLESFREDFN